MWNPVGVRFLGRFRDPGCACGDPGLGCGSPSGKGMDAEGVVIISPNEWGFWNRLLAARPL